METLQNPVLRAIPQKRTVPRLGIRLAILLAFAAGGTVFYYLQVAQQATDRLHPNGIKGIPDPSWMSVSWAALSLAPSLLSLVLLSIRRGACVAAGAGIAGGFFATLLLLSPAMGMGLFVALALSQSQYLLHIAGSFLALIAISIWVVIAAIWTGKTNWIVTNVAAGATFLCITSGIGSLRNAHIEFQRAARQQKQEDEFYRHRPRPVGARQNLLYLASCLFQNHFANSTFPYPLAIDPKTRWFCDTKFGVNTVPDFKLSYAPQTNPVTGNVVDFQLVALPKRKGVANYNPLMIDHRGIVFVRNPWAENMPSGIIATPGDGVSSQLTLLKANIESYMKEKNGGVAPATLSAEIIGAFPYETPTVDESGTFMQTKNFSYVYLAPKPEAPNQFGLIVQCQSYAENCLRSYFLDYDGSIHGTAEPRQPTREDPSALACEFVPSECKDVSWSVR
jgi:hypothetical protein